MTSPTISMVSKPQVVTRIKGAGMFCRAPTWMNRIDLTCSHTWGSRRMGIIGNILPRFSHRFVAAQKGAGMLLFHTSRPREGMLDRRGIVWTIGLPTGIAILYLNDRLSLLDASVCSFGTQCHPDLLRVGTCSNQYSTYFSFILLACFLGARSSALSHRPRRRRVSSHGAAPGFP